MNLDKTSTSYMLVITN